MNRSNPLEIHRYEDDFPIFYIDQREDRYEEIRRNEPNDHQAWLQLEYHIDPKEDRYETLSGPKL